MNRTPRREVSGIERKSRRFEVESELEHSISALLEASSTRGLATITDFRYARLQLSHCARAAFSSLSRLGA